MFAIALAMAITPDDGGLLLLNDDDDAPVPLVASRPAASQNEAAADASTGAVLHTLAHPSQVPPADLQQAVDWVCSPLPTIGIRRWFLKATGINLGPSRRERELRRLFRVLYRASHNHEGATPCH